MWFKKTEIKLGQLWFYNTAQYLCIAEVTEVTITSVKFKKYLYEYDKLVSTRNMNILTRKKFRKEFHFYK